MVHETEKMVAKEEAGTSSSINDVGGEESEVEEGEIVTGNSEDSEALKAMAAPPPPSHPLEHAWTFWFDTPSAKQNQVSWGNSMRPIYTTSTIEDFWRVYNNVRRPSLLVTGMDFYCFKNKIEPKWEDPVCANGGNWTLSFSMVKSDASWLYTLLAMIGEQFDYGDEICGAVVNIRKQVKISLWTKNAANEGAQLSIGKQWKEFLDCTDSIMGFIFHEDLQQLDKGAKSRYTV